MKLAEVAQKLGCRLEGEPEIEIRSVAGIEYAESGQLTFLANRRYFPLLKTTRASAVLIEESVAVEREAGLPALATLRSPNPYLAFAHAIELFYQPLRYAPGIHPTAVIAKSASIGEGSHIGPYCFIDEGCPRILPHRQPRDSPERRDHWWRRTRFRETKRWDLVQIGAVRAGHPGR